MKIYLPSALLFSALAFSSVHASAASQDPVPVKKASKKVRTGFHWTIAPATVQVYVDDKKIGIAGDLDVTKTKPGKHTVRLVNGEDETEFDVMVKKGTIVELRYEFTDG